MIFAKFLWINVFFGGKLQIYAKNLNFKNFESALYMKSVSMPLTTEFICKTSFTQVDPCNLLGKLQP